MSYCRTSLGLFEGDAAALQSFTTSSSSAEAQAKAAQAAQTRADLAAQHGGYGTLTPLSPEQKNLAAFLKEKRLREQRMLTASVVGIAVLGGAYLLWKRRKR